MGWFLITNTSFNDHIIININHQVMRLCWLVFTFRRRWDRKMVEIRPAAEAALFMLLQLPLDANTHQYRIIDDLMPLFGKLSEEEDAPKNRERHKDRQEAQREYPRRLFIILTLQFRCATVKQGMSQCGISVLLPTIALTKQ